MAKKKILILVEGEKTDVKVMEKIFEVYGIDHNYDIVPYKTNIYTLYKRIFNDIYDPEDNDIIQVLKEREKSDEVRKILDQKFTDILLVFDLDPHDSEFTIEKITKMQSHFSESTDMGKLYLNYPMIEAFYHMKTLPDKDFLDRDVSMDELKNKQYKKRVQSESKGKDYRKFAVNRIEYDEVLFRNIQKALYMSQQILINDKNEIANYNINHLEILSEQMNELNEKSKIKVLCTCIFYVLDYDSRILENRPARKNQ